MFGENELYKFFKNLKFKEEFIIIHPDLLSFYQFKVKVNKFWEILNFCIGSKRDNESKTCNEIKSSKSVILVRLYFLFSLLKNS